MNGTVEFDYGMYSIEVEYIAQVTYDEGTYDVPPQLEWDVNEDDLTIQRTDENGESEYIDVNLCDEEFLDLMHQHINNDIEKEF